MTNAGTGMPFDDIRALVRDMPGPDMEAAAKCRAREGQLTKPPGALGRLEGISEWLAAWQGHHPPRTDRTVVAVFAGNHGVVAQGVAAYPQAVTAQMVANFRNDGAAVNQICKQFDLGLKVFELALEIPTRDITQDAALDEDACAATMAYGMEAVADGCDLLCIGEMGIGNTTIAAAICHGLYGGTPEDWVGPGTGLDAAGLARKADAVRRAVALHRPHLKDPLEVLRRLGGRQLARPWPAPSSRPACSASPSCSTATAPRPAAAVLYAMDKRALDHCLAGHRSADPPTSACCKRSARSRSSTSACRAGELRAALAAAIVKAAAALHNGMATFESAGVSGKGASRFAARFPPRGEKTARISTKLPAAAPS